LTTDSNGHCLCGRFNFAVLGHPRFVAHCHCESCRRALAAPLATYVGFTRSQVTFLNTGGIDRVPYYVSSPGVRRGFCDHCGSALFYTATKYPEETHLFRSNFSNPDDFDPTGHVFFDEHEIDLYDDLPRYAQGSGVPCAWGHKPAFRILFLCTGNSARSILAEGITNLRAASVGARRIRAHSAGSTPTGEVRPEAMQLLDTQRYRLGVIRSKSWDEFCTPQSPEIDLVITLCDQAAAETCPVFPGRTQQRHWGMPDPASGAVSFNETYSQLETRITDLIAELTA
jgi:arsenate reductase (thioredoxin)